MDFLGLLYSIAAFIVAIGVLVTVHEFGHFWVARKLGVKVLRFSVGFGKPLWMRKAGPDQTEYVIASLPLGGYVKMLDEREAEVDPSELERAFNRKSVWRRIAIVAADGSRAEVDGMTIRRAVNYGVAAYAAGSAFGPSSLIGKGMRMQARGVDDVIVQTGSVVELNGELRPARELEAAELERLDP